MDVSSSHLTVAVFIFRVYSRKPKLFQQEIQYSELYSVLPLCAMRLEGIFSAIIIKIIKTYHFLSAGAVLLHGAVLIVVCCTVLLNECVKLTVLFWFLNQNSTKALFINVMM